MRLLDPALRTRVGGIGDLTASIDDLERLDITPRHVVIVENLQTGLALDDVPSTVALMALGYAVDSIARLPWVRNADCLYWGDIDTHGFSILSRLRAQLPAVRSMLMDEATLLAHRALWTGEASQHTALELPYLTPGEQAVYRTLRLHVLGPSVRLEQERIAWDIAWPTLVDALAG
jgi:hypothetical protein